MKALKDFLSEYFANKRIQQTPFYLIALLTFNMLVIVMFTIILLYNLGFNHQKERLKELVSTQAVMIHVVAEQEFLLHKNLSSEMKKRVAENIIRKVSQAHYGYAGFGKTGEFTLGKRDGDKIQFLIKQRHYKMEKPTSILWNSHLGEPMRRALKGVKGVDVTYDYRGAVVLAAYEPIRDLNWGLVAKIDLAEIRAPYIEAAQYALGLTILLAFGGSVIFWYFLHPLVQNIEDSRRFNRILIENSSTGLALCTFNGEIIDANTSFLDIIGLNDDEANHLNYFDLIADELRDQEKKYLNTLKKTGCITPYESIFINVYHERISVKIAGKLISMKGLSYIWLSVDNIQEYKIREAELLLSDAVFHNTSEVIFITDASKNIIKVNEAFISVTGFTFDEVAGKNPRIFKSGKHDSQFYEEIFLEVNATGKWHGEIWNKRKNGEIYPSLQSISAIHDENGHLIRYVAVMSDISLQKAYEEQLLIDSHHDSLTGLPNRLFFNQMLSQTLARSERGNKTFALFFIDLNQFKEVNDTYGHECGDKLLEAVAERLKENIRIDDFVARLGGDEFTIIFESIQHPAEAITVAKTLIEKAKRPLIVDECTIIPSISIGIAFYPGHGTDGSTLLKCADQAMYHAKHQTSEHYFIYGT
ncbi:MAG: diguanylate cyclase [Sulfuricurvum sp.]|uniref:sensor domain-containing protein n=1 Tax=Sulfuricurvum sp. TaxID=2025608 RepID=UPI00271C40CC|nr:diguanylate cyclase [Sulfuricurvum sp.]MDO9055076.1 diguanylate cyclase [Sulfuricurvum sp.]